MDDVRVYKRALSASEIQALYGTMPPSMPTAPLPANQAVGVVVNPGIGTEPPNFVHLRTTVSDPDSSNLTVRFYGREYCEAAPSFSLVALPDTQYYSSGTSSGTPTMFYSQTQWIVNNQAIRNIAYATHLGDIVNTYSTGAEWEIAGKTTDPKGALTRLDDAGIPYGLTIGNHDGGPSNTANFTRTSLPPEWATVTTAATTTTTTACSAQADWISSSSNWNTIRLQTRSC